MDSSSSTHSLNVFVIPLQDGGGGDPRNQDETEDIHFGCSVSKVLLCKEGNVVQAPHEGYYEALSPELGVWKVVLGPGGLLSFVGKHSGVLVLCL